MADKHGFPKTHQSMINRIQEGDEEARQIALSEFANNYRVPLLNFLVKRMKIDLHTAEETFQQFFLDKILAGKVLDRATEKGRLRDWLRTCLRNFFLDQLKASQKENDKIKRYFDDLMEQENDTGEVVHPADRIWAKAIYRAALIRLKNESQYWDIFFDLKLAAPQLSYEQMVKKYKFSDSKAASNRLMTAQRQLNRIITDSLSQQNQFSDTYDDADLQKDIDVLLKVMNDSQFLGGIAMTLDDKGENLTASKSTTQQHSIYGERILFVEESPNRNWGKGDAGGMLKHLLAQPVSDFVPADSLLAAETFNSVLFEQANSESHLELARKLKQHFNDEGKSKQSLLPERVTVTMTFTMIAHYVLLGGEVEGITSMRRNVLANRLEKLVNKSWIPKEIQELIANAVAKLLS